MGDYFANQSQTLRFSNAMSNMHDIKLGVPKGLVFGSLLFLIFINDLAFVLEMATELFADFRFYATTKKTNNSLTDLISIFLLKLNPLI